MANRLTKYTGTPDNTKRFSLNPFSGIIDDPIGWAWEHSPGAITQGFVDDLTGGDTSGLVEDVAGYIMDPLTNKDEVEDAYANAQKTLEAQQAAAREGYGQASEAIGDTRGEIADLIGPETMAMYKHNLLFLNPENYTADTSPIAGFNFDRDVSKYLDPSAEYQIDQATKQVLQSMSGEGGLSGGAASRAIAAETSAKAGELYGDAFDRMMKATEQEYGKARDTVSAEQTNAQNKFGVKKYQTEGLGNLAGSYVGNLQGLTEDQVKLLLAQLATDSSYASSIAQLAMDKASQPTWLQEMLGMGGDAAKIYTAFKG